jgi:5-methylcytosine-specific restriction endonuclease McrA
VSDKIKRCTKCHTEYPRTREYFSPDKRCCDGLQSRCKACGRDYRKQKWIEDPDKIREANKEYYNKNAEKEIAKSREWVLEHPEEHREYMKNYRIKNAEKLSEYMRIYWIEKIDKAEERKRLRNYYSENPHKRSEHSRKQYLLHPDRFLIQGQRRAARKRGLPYTLTPSEWKYAIKFFEDYCIYCRTKSHKLTMDHFIPLNNPMCPGTVAHNIVPACKSCNSSKGSSDAFAWMSWKFGEKQAQEVIEQVTAYFLLITP